MTVGGSITTTTTYVAGGLEEIVSNGAGSTLSKYFSGASGLPTVERVGTNGPLSYLGSDGLGSVSEALDGSGSGNVTYQQLYSPYGTVRYTQGSSPTSHGYTGQQADGATGLDYYRARYYDPLAGQFTSADSVADGLNRYGYVNGNPTTATDPSGHRVIGNNGDRGGGVTWDWTGDRYSLYKHSLSHNVHIRPDLVDKPIVQRVGPELISQAKKVITRQNDEGGPNDPNNKQARKYPTYGAAVLGVESLDNGFLPFDSGVITGTNPNRHAEEQLISWAVRKIVEYREEYGFDGAFNAFYDVNLLVTKDPCKGEGSCTEKFLVRDWLNQLLAAAGAGYSATVALFVWVIQPAGWNPEDPKAGNPEETELSLWGSDGGMTSINPGWAYKWWNDHAFPLPPI